MGVSARIAQLSRPVLIGKPGRAPALRGGWGGERDIHGSLSSSVLAHAGLWIHSKSISQLPPLCAALPLRHAPMDTQNTAASPQPAEAIQKHHSRPHHLQPSAAHRFLCGHSAAPPARAAPPPTRHGGPARLLRHRRLLARPETAGLVSLVSPITWRTMVCTRRCSTLVQHCRHDHKKVGAAQHRPWLSPTAPPQ